jgi:hypothetical protein
MYKILSTKSPYYLYSKLQGLNVKPYYTTRFCQTQKQNQIIKLGPDSQAECDTARKSFKYRATSQWNALPLQIKQARTVNEFKIKLRKWVAENIPIK